MRMLPAVRLTGARSLRDGEMQDRSVVIEDGRISKGPRAAVDLRGYDILPGIIDLHARSAGQTLQALTRTDRAAAQNGITTAWLAQDCTPPLENSDKVLKWLTIFTKNRPHLMTDLRLQLCYDPQIPGDADRLIHTIREHALDHVLFPPPRDEAHELAPHVVRHLCQLAEAFDELGVVYGTLGDQSAERRERFAMIGARLCMLPSSRRPAAAAHAFGNPVFLSARQIEKDDVLQGNTHARGLVRAGIVRGLVSNGSFAGMAGGAFALDRCGLRGLPQAWAMISTLPAEVMRLSDRGVIDYGKRADLVVVNRSSHKIEATIRAGCLSHLTGEAANRFAPVLCEGRLAAE